ncbi:MAG: hypothetical protein KIT38_12600 [Gemmatimonadaceae bacterium]|nr:hypothetical protein [Gemmatimonadaceae bacterium]
MASNTAGGATSTEAVMLFVEASRRQDLQAMSMVWGNEESLTRDRVDRAELERRLLIIVCHVRHDESRIGAAQLGEAGRVIHRVETVRGSRSATIPFTTVKNSRSGRWFVEDIDLRPAREICNAEPVTRPVP